MNQASIQKALEAACQNPELIFQLSEQQPFLHICINRPGSTELDYPALTKAIRFELAKLRLPGIEHLTLYSREAGTQTPDWQTTIALQTVPERLPTMPLAAKPALSGVARVVPGDQPDLSSHCFIRNRLLLTADLKPPPAVVAQAVLTFNNLTAAQKQAAIPALQQTLDAGELRSDGALSAEVQAWLQTVASLEPEALRKAAIWLSRYCHKPEETVLQSLAVADPNRYQKVVDTRAVAQEAAGKRTGQVIANVPTGVQVSPERRKKKRTKRVKRRKRKEGDVEEVVEEVEEVVEEDEATPDGDLVDEDDEYEYVEVDLDELGKNEPVKLLSVLCHGSVWIIFCGLTAILPIVVLSVSYNSVIKENATQALKFFIFSVFCGVLVGGLWVLNAFVVERPGLDVLIWVCGLLALGFNLVMPVIAIAACYRNPQKPFIYPFVRRLF